MNLEKLDQNLKIETQINEPDLIFSSATCGKFEICGSYDVTSNRPFGRVPEDVAAATSQAVINLKNCTTGVRVRFQTNSRYIAIKAEYKGAGRVPMMTLVGSAGFDLYTKENGCFKFHNIFAPPFDVEYGYESVTYFNEGQEEVLIHLPLLTHVEQLYIGLAEGSEILPPTKYRHTLPVVFYGSSIVHGVGACRPGNAYPSMISRWLDTEFLNLGFSGSARAEEPMMQYIAGLEMSVFVYDYDHNAPNAEFLALTHEKGFKIIREKNSNLPVVFVTRPDFEPNVYDSTRRREVIFKTYQNAVATGDQNVYFVDGESFYRGQSSEECTSDGCHPNDLGYAKMAEVLASVLKKLI